MTETQPANQERIRILQEQIAALRRQWPAHSIPPGLMLRLDELEEQLEKELELASQPR